MKRLTILLPLLALVTLWGGCDASEPDQLLEVTVSRVGEDVQLVDADGDAMVIAAEDVELEPSDEASAAAGPASFATTIDPTYAMCCELCDCNPSGCTCRNCEVCPSNEPQ